MIITSEYNYSRVYSGVIEKWPKKFSILLGIASYIMQEMGMYVVIFMAALLDFFFQEQVEYLLFGFNFKSLVLIFYAVSMTIMTTYNIFGSNRMIVEFDKNKR